MAIIVDPDNLDRYQVLVDPIGASPTIALKPLGAQVIAKRTDGQVIAQAASNFVSAGAGFTGVVDVGDILTIPGKPTIASDKTGVIRHYVVDAIVNDTTLTVIPQPGSADTGLTFKINEADPLAPPSSIEDGVTLQCVYSFLKEEWRTLADADFPDLIKFVFPLLTITREQFEIGGTDNGNWDWFGGYSDQTRKLVRTGGWLHRHTDGVEKSDYAGDITLGSLDSDAQAYYQQVLGGNPTNYVLTGAVNQAIQTYGDAGHGNFDYRNYLTLRCRKRARSYAQSTIADIGVTTLEAIVNRFPLAHAEDPAIVDPDGEIQGTESASNTYQYVGPTAKDSGADGTTEDKDGDGKIGKFTSAGGSFNTDLAVGDVLELEEGADLGYYEIVKVQSATELWVDTSTTGAWATASSLDWKVWTRVRSAAKADGSLLTKLFSAVNLTFAAAGSTITRAAGNWTTDGYVVQGYVTVEGSVSNDGTYLIASIDSATQITVIATLSDEGPVSCTHSHNTYGRLTSAGADFVTDGVEDGDLLLITDTTTATLEGCYEIVDVVNLTTLELDTSDQFWPSIAEGSADFVVLKTGMRLQYKKVTCTAGSSVNLTFAAGAKTITRASGDWVAGGYRQGGYLTITGAVNTANNGNHVIASVDSTTQITVLETLVDEGPVSCSWTGSYGFKRRMSTTGNWFPFNWRMRGNTGTLAGCYQKVQRELRNLPTADRTGDIDDASTTARGDITDLLMTFSTPTGVTLNMFIDDLATTDKNNATYKDATGTSRTFPFTSSISISISSTLVDDAQTKIVVFWTDAPNQFGTAGALPVQDENGSDMISTNPSASPITFSYNYDATQNGHGGSADEEVTLVGIGAATAQYVLATGTITRQNTNSFALVSPLERNYQNP